MAHKINMNKYSHYCSNSISTYGVITSNYIMFKPNRFQMFFKSGNITNVLKRTDT